MLRSYQGERGNAIKLLLNHKLKKGMALGVNIVHAKHKPHVHGIQLIESVDLT